MPRNINSSLMKPLVVLAFPGMYLVYKINEYKRQQQEQNRRKVTERELAHLNHKIDKLLTKLEEHEPELASSQDEECVICISAKATMQTFPCGHRVVCRKCFVKTIQMAVSQRMLPLRCVICRTKIIRLKQTTHGKATPASITQVNNHHLASTRASILRPNPCEDFLKDPAKAAAILNSKELQQQHTTNATPQHHHHANSHTCLMHKHWKNKVGAAPPPMPSRSSTIPKVTLVDPAKQPSHQQKPPPALPPPPRQQKSQPVDNHSSNKSHHKSPLDFRPQKIHHYHPPSRFERFRDFHVRKPMPLFPIPEKEEPEYSDIRTGFRKVTPNDPYLADIAQKIPLLKIENDAPASSPPLRARIRAKMSGLPLFPSLQQLKTRSPLKALRSKHKQKSGSQPLTAAEECA